MFSAPVTAIKILPHHRICLAGTGPYVIVFDLTTNQQLFQTKILTDSVVHGFEARQIRNENDDSSYLIVVFGQRTFSIIQWSSISPSAFLTVVPQTQCPSWIISALIVHLDPSIESSVVLFGTALNQIYRYKNTLSLLQSFKYTTLYSSCLFHHTDESVIFAAGTVFGELILHEQDTTGDFHEKTSVADHNGAIFGITYHENLLCTVGDDRTVKLYHFTNSLQLLSSTFAHEARIWQSSLTSTHILTCGEDSSIRLWSQKSTGELLRCFSVHRCKSAWCMDILRDDENDQPLVIISGWSDGGVRRYHLDDVPVDSHEKILLKATLENDFPRNVVFFNSTVMIAHMNSGQLLKIDQDNISVFFDGRNLLKNGYAKMSVAKDGNEYLAVGSLDGSVFIFDRHGLIKNQFQVDANRNKKILQLLWLNQTLSSKLLVCVPDGMMFIYNISNQPATIDHRLEDLPEFEQRWPNTCLHVEQYKLLLVGDRQGNILSYDLDNQSNCSIYQKLDRLHGNNGTSAIDIDEKTHLIRSCGRDGYINLFSIDVQQRQLVHQLTSTITSDITWLDHLENHPSVITCFTTNHFCLYTLDEQTKRRLMQVECGGGHRNHDFFIDTNFYASFAYVRNKQICLAQKNLRRILNESTCLSLTPPTHGTEIRCVKLFQFKCGLYMLTGSEDTQMKLFSLQKETSNGRCEHLSTLQSHLSAVCDIVTVEHVFFSCGARAQVFAWQMKDNIVIRSGHFMLHPLRRRHGGGGHMNDSNKIESSDEDHGLDVRFTSIAAVPTAHTGNYLLFVTGSDAILRVFRYSTASNRFTLLQTCSHSEYCQLRVKVYSARTIVFVSSTDGQICAYDLSTFDQPIRSTSVQIHQSGVNDFDFSEINPTKLLRLASVGDDGSVHVSMFDIDQWSWMRECAKDCTHQSPATGIRFLNSSTFVSIGIDQRLKLWSIKSDEKVLELRRSHLVDIRDILSMDTIFCDDKGEFLIVIAGAGVQTIRFDPTTYVLLEKDLLNEMLIGIHSMEKVFQPSDLRTALYDGSNYFYCIAYGLLVYLSLFFYFLTCYIDPGYVPYKRVPNWTGGVVTSSDDDEDDKQPIVPANSKHLRKCLLCNIEQPLRSHHCDFCNRCVLKYDHHCPYLETCIGQQNHRYFWYFLLTTDILILWSMMICSRSFVPFSDWSSWLHVNKFRIFAMHVLIVSVCATTVLFCIHSFFALTNSTTWERVSRHRITYLNRLPNDDLNPFHQGYCHNFFYSFLCQRMKEQQWDIVYKKRLEEHVTLNM